MALECLRLRVKNVAFTRNEIVVRDGKGGKDRVKMLPVDHDRVSHLFGYDSMPVQIYFSRSIPAKAPPDHGIDPERNLRYMKLRHSCLRVLTPC